MERERETSAQKSQTAAAMPRITVETRNVYGMTRVYPVCATAKRLAAVAGTKTLTDHAIVEIRKLGFDIVDRAAIGAQLARMLTAA